MLFRSLLIIITHAFLLTLCTSLSQRITIPEILQDEWFKRGYKPPQFEQEQDVNLDDIDAVFNDSMVRHFVLRLFCFSGKRGLI